jgi:glutathione synthase
MEAAQLAGHRVHSCTIAELAVSSGRAVARCRELRLRPAVLNDGKWIADTDWYTASDHHHVHLRTMSAVFMRTDPPVNADYLRATFILDLIDPAQTLVINSPAGLRDANEHMFALRMPELGPPTIVTADREDIVSTVRAWGKAVLKPIDGMAGRGVMLLCRDDPNLRSILDSATVRGRDHVVVQQYLPAVSNGDRRVIVLDGAPLGAMRRVAAADEFRCNMAVGAAVYADTVDDHDREICRLLGPELVRRVLYFVGIDVIGGVLTEVNVTSPTCVREIDALNGTSLAADIIDWTAANCGTTRVGSR